MSITAVATMTSKGQLTIPKAVREALGLYEGGRVRFEVDSEQGTAALEPVKLQVSDLWAFAVPGAPTMSLEDMDQAIQRGATR
ncbi:AbrB/MazE/SpoVT family DNA-binding domain-containing protein [Holophaga foetida]|uniref:AbrB/MazE/SpoVT family DNA-binding domain-containing protein n=1 Tax=Holophaga foetida TaxID=35839 RepID=UPI000247183B|nr:AbrB/MazE/SpoVT family DNA-binding domain-containing protein [Holophaga foetida]